MPQWFIALGRFCVLIFSLARHLHCLVEITKTEMKIKKHQVPKSVIKSKIKGSISWFFSTSKEHISKGIYTLFDMESKILIIEVCDENNNVKWQFQPSELNEAIKKYNSL